ncbi:hypothetical protein D3C87_1977100 [compost metagenome]
MSPRTAKSNEKRRQTTVWRRFAFLEWRVAARLCEDAGSGIQFAARADAIRLLSRRRAPL